MTIKTRTLTCKACVQFFEPLPQSQRYNSQISDLSAGPWAGRGGQEETGHAGMRRSGQDATKVPVLGILLACLKLLGQGWGECIRWPQKAVQRSSSPEEKSSRPHPPGQKSSQAPGRPIPGASSVPRCYSVGIPVLPTRRLPPSPQTYATAPHPPNTTCSFGWATASSLPS